jgi:TRAP-type mannitol/chloroaromatic compound transport system substrate-binding protein
MLSEYTARNNQALDTLINKHSVKVLPLPDTVLKKLQVISEQVVADITAKDPVSKKIYTSLMQFKKQVIQWDKISEQAFFRAREL